MNKLDRAHAVAHISIAAPRELLAAGHRRVDVFLQRDGDGGYRWYHADGRATVVNGGSVDHAFNVANMVWSDVRLVSRTDDTAPA